MWNEFDATVEEIAELTSMPMKLKKVIKRSRNFNRGDVLALNRLQFKIQGGNMVFGRAAVLRNANTLGMAFSLHLVLEINNVNHKMPGHSRNFLRP